MESTQSELKSKAKANTAVDDRNLPPFITVGRFWTTRPFDYPKQRLLLEEIEGYFTDDKLHATLLQFLTKDEGGYGVMSKRDMDWLVTNYSKKKQIYYRWRRSPKEPEQVIHIHNRYKSWLRQNRRNLFDIFCRGQRVYFRLDNNTFETTVGQLNFLYWADTHGVIHYLKENHAEIALAHHQRQAQSRTEKKTCGNNMRKRHELTQAPPSQCKVLMEATEFRWI